MSAVQASNRQYQQADGTWALTASAGAAPPAYHPAQLQNHQQQQHRQQHTSSALVPAAAPAANQWGLQPQQHQQPPPQQPQAQQYQQIQHAQHQHQQQIQQQQQQRHHHQQQQQFDPFTSSSAPATNNASSATSLVAAQAPVAYQQTQHHHQQLQQQHHTLSALPPAPLAVAAAPPMPQDDDPFGVFSAAAAAAGPPKPEMPRGYSALTASATSSATSVVATSSTTSSVAHRFNGNSGGETFSSTSVAAAQAQPAGANNAAAPSWLDVSTSTNNLVGGGSGPIEAVAYALSSDGGGLPSEGDYYQADVTDRHLGLVLHRAADLSTSILSHHHPATVKSLARRPVVAHLTEHSSAAAAGIGLGDVVTAVNGREVTDRADASRMLRECGRPATLRVYRLPGTSPRLYEGEVSVHYKNKNVEPPRSTKDWKAKYVVVGGIMGPPSAVNMYRSRSDYDRAVAEVHDGRPVSVKVKQFSLEGSSLWSLPAEQVGHGRQPNGVETLRYSTEAEGWKYAQVLVPKPGNNIKIAAPVSRQNELRSVLEGIRRGM